VGGFPNFTVEMETGTGKTYVYRNDTTLYFVAETKKTGSGDHVQLDLLRPIEDLRIECGKRHFKNFEQVRFKVVSTLEELVN